MFVSSINNKNAQIRTEAKINSRITQFSIVGSTLEIEGYSYVDGVLSYSEDRIRKTLMFIPEVNIEAYRENHEDKSVELTDDEIIALHVIEIALENYKLSEIINDKGLETTDADSLGGFKGKVNLTSLADNKPLQKGVYTIYIKLEQLSESNDSVKYVKMLPLANIKELMGEKLLSTHLHYYSANRVIKYNLIASFDTIHKTLKFDNILLQSFNPEDLSHDGMTKESPKKQTIKRKFFKLLYILMSILPVNKNKISFASDSRSELNGNLYFIYEELYDRNLNLDIKFIFNDKISNKKSFSALAKMAFHFATSKIILIDDFYPLIYPINIRENTDLVQVWHAAGAFKTFGFSRVGRPGGPSPKSRNHRNYSKATVSSEGVREHYAEGFGITVDKVYPTGVPRSDIFFDKEYSNHVKKVLFERFPFVNGKKVILFAPTFRGNGQSSAYYPYETINFKELYDAFKDEYVFLFKMHPFIKNKLSIPYEYSEFFYDVSSFREINDLLLITDILITDYSSVCFEFALLNKPMLFYAFDVEEYIQERDFYYDYYDFIPGPLVKTTSEIVEKIKNEKFETEKIEAFVNYFFNDTLGNASKNIVDNVIIPSLEKRKELKDEKKVVLTPPKSRLDLFDRSLENE